MLLSSELLDVLVSFEGFAKKPRLFYRNVKFYLKYFPSLTVTFSQRVNSATKKIFVL